MRINNNLMAVNTHRQLGISQLDAQKSTEKLSSGFRINRAGDDAAGLAISEKMRGQIRGLTQASRNANDTISLIQTAEGALGETHSILQRMRELSVQSANDTNTDADRSEIQNEITQLIAEIDRIGNTTEFNTKKLLEGSAQGVSAEVAGTIRVNNNSGVTVDPLKMGSLEKIVGNDKSWAFKGAYMLVKTNQTFSADNPSVAEYNVSDFKLVGHNGVQYSFVDAGGATLGQTELDVIDNTIVGSGSYTLSGATLTGAITLGTGGSTASVTTFGEGSVLSKGSTFGTTTAVELNVDGKVVEIKAGTGTNIEINGTIVATNKSYVLDDGTVLKNSGGTISVEQGRVTLAKTQALTNATLKQDSTLAKDSVISSATLGVGSVIQSADAAKAGKSPVDGSIVLGANAQSITFGQTHTMDGTDYDTDKAATLTADFDSMKVTESFTFIFQDYEAASSNLKDSIMGQIGANSGQTTFVSMSDMRAKALNVDQIDVSTKWGAATAIETVNNALQKVSHQRANLGAIQNRLEHTIKNLDTTAENLQASESRIRDVDMAKEIMENTTQNILQQAGQAMLAQANQAPQSVLQLLR